jgi:hypothetical protein
MMSIASRRADVLHAQRPASSWVLCFQSLAHDNQIRQSATAIRDSENRVLFSGYATANFKLFIFIYAAVISGLAGALYTPQVGIINPSEMSPEKSLEAVVWVAVGGRGTLVGPIIGSVGVNALKSWATLRPLANLWLIILGPLRLDRSLHAQGNRRHPRPDSELRKRFKEGSVRAGARKWRGELRRRMKTDFILTAEESTRPSMASRRSMI